MLILQYNAISAHRAVVLADEDRFRDRVEDALAEIAAAIVHIEAGNRKDYPFGIFLFMRQIAYDNMDAKFLLESGNRIMIKRKLFEEFLDRASVI